MALLAYRLWWARGEVAHSMERTAPPVAALTRTTNHPVSLSISAPHGTLTAQPFSLLFVGPHEACAGGGALLSKPPWRTTSARVRPSPLTDTDSSRAPSGR